jgi:hypothetical protein
MKGKSTIKGKSVVLNSKREKAEREFAAAKHQCDVVKRPSPPLMPKTPGSCGNCRCHAERYRTHEPILPGQDRQRRPHTASRRGPGARQSAHTESFSPRERTQADQGRPDQAQDRPRCERERAPKA